MNSVVYIVKEQIDDTQQIIRAVFSTIDKAHEYKKEHLRLIGDPNFEKGFLFPVECWLVDYDFSSHYIE